MCRTGLIGLRLIDLAGTSYGANSIAFANVGGAVQNVGGVESRPFIYRNGSIQVLPTLGGNAGAAYAVSNRGHVTGQAALATTAPLSGGGHAFLYQNGNMSDLGTLRGDDTSSGLDVNDLGEVVGISGVSGRAGKRSFLAFGGRMIDLNRFIDPASGWAINAALDINDSFEILVRGRRARSGTADWPACCRCSGNEG